MKHKYALLLALASLGLCTLAPATARAQADFRPGYIVKLAGDTVRGEVDYRGAAFSATRCRFRPTAGVAETTFEPSDLRGYGLSQEQKAYASFALPDTVAHFFLETVVRGPASLYYFRDGQQHDRFYITTASFPLTELIYRKVRVARGGSVYLNEQNIFRNTLAQALAGCPAVQRKLTVLSFYERDLAKAVVAYNQCINPGGPLAAPVATTRQSLQIGIVLGVAQTRLALNGGGTFYTSTPLYDNLHFKANTVPVIGLSFRLPLSRLSRKLSLGAELFYETQKYADNFTPQNIPLTRTYSRLEFDLAYLRLPISVRYTFPGKIRPLVEAGPTLAYALKKTNTGYPAFAGGANNSPYQVFDGDDFRSLEFGAMLGTGLQTNYWQGRRATVLIRYERSNGFSDYNNTSTTIQRVYGLLVFDLTK